ncbi:MAG TPA: nuclear transport factor 2 family protein [Chloroflexota bacterium]|nr:nuclear transport factor 2 family protein [Chloroflexota bacterium]
MDIQQFIAALREIEERADVEPMVGLFAPDARLWSPEREEPLVGSEGARQFWQSYRDTFGTIESSFRTIITAKDDAALEWESTGTLRANNQRIYYRGVTILDWAGDQIKRLAVYFDPRRLEVVWPARAARR